MGPQSAAPKELEKAGLREFRCAANAAAVSVDESEEAFRGAVEEIAVESDRSPRRARAQALHQDVAVAFDRVGLLAENAGDFLEDGDESGTAITGGLREVGAAPDRRAVGREKHGEGPAALLAEGME